MITPNATSIGRILLHDGDININGWELLQASCYPMLKNESNKHLVIQLAIHKNGQCVDVIQQSWPTGYLPDVGIAMHLLEMKTIGYGYDGDIESLIEDAYFDGLRRKDIIQTNVKLSWSIVKVYHKS